MLHTGLNYRSARFLLHRIRYAVAQDPTDLKGNAELDEAEFGGTVRYPNRKSGPDRGTKKQPILVLVERGGRVQCRAIPNVFGVTLKAAILEAVDPSATMHTNEWRSYHGIGKHFAGGDYRVKRAAKEYPRMAPK